MPRLLPRAGTQRGSLARYLTGRPWDRIPELAMIEQAFGLWYAEDATFSGTDLTSWVDRLGLHDMSLITTSAPQSSTDGPSGAGTVVDHTTDQGARYTLTTGERDDVNTAWETSTVFCFVNFDTDSSASATDPSACLGFSSNFVDRECLLGINNSQEPMIRYGSRQVGNDINTFVGDTSLGEPTGWKVLMLNFDGRNSNPAPMRMFADEDEQTLDITVDADSQVYHWLDDCRNVSSSHDMTAISLGCRYDVGSDAENDSDCRIVAAGWFRTLMSAEVMMTEIYWTLRRKYGS